MWSYNLLFISWQVLVRRSNGILHPFSITLENDLLFWSDWTNDSIFATHKLDGGNIFTVYHNLLLNPNGIEAVTPDRQILSECHSFCLCILWCYYEHHVIGWFQKCCEVEKRFLNLLWGIQFSSLSFISANNTCSGSGCSHICLLSAVRTEGFTCMCPDGFPLGENDKECNRKPILQDSLSNWNRGRA